jgi:hypothetical protein
MGMLRASSLVAVIGAAVLAAVLADSLCNDEMAPRASLLAFLEEGPRGQKLDADQQIILHSREVIEQIVTDLIDGRLSLREAAANLRTENEQRSSRLRMGSMLLPVDQTEEHFCRLAIEWIKGRLSAHKDPRLLDVVRRLEGDLRAYLVSRDSLDSARVPGAISGLTPEVLICAPCDAMAEPNGRPK